MIDTLSEWTAKSCCFTGHRPEKLHLPEAIVREQLSYAIDAAIREGYTRFLTGMSRGVDLWAAQEVIRRQKEYPQLRLVACIPYQDFEKGWGLSWQRVYRQVLEACEEIHIFSRAFSMESFSLRNRYMVEHAALVIAVFGGEKGGTANTLRYARRLSRRILIISDDGQMQMQIQED